MSMPSGIGKIVILLVLAGAVTGVLLLRHANNGTMQRGNEATVQNTAPAVPQATKATAGQAKALPRLLDLGADKCIPCKMMQPVLAELRKEYTGKLQVDFIDVWKNPSAGDKYGIRVIPTQILFDATGKEVFRHTGFYAKDEILARFKEFGIAL